MQRPKLPDDYACAVLQELAGTLQAMDTAQAQHQIWVKSDQKSHTRTMTSIKARLEQYRYLEFAKAR